MPWKTLLTPYLTFAAGAVTFQLLLPSTLVPDNGNSRRYIATRLWSLDNQPTGRQRPQYPAHLVSQLGLHEPAVFGRWMIGLAALGAIVGCVKAPRRNVPLAVLGLTTMLVIGTHLRMVSRYYMQITPLIVFFVALLLLYVVGWLGRLVARRPLPLAGRRIVALLAAAPFLWLAVYHATDLPRRVDAAQAYNDSGAVQRGPAQEQNQTAMDAIDKYTPPDDIVVYYRARTATLYTGRQALQTTSLNNMVANGDWFMQNKKDNYSQVVATPEQLTAAGFELVWENNDWRLWRIPDGPVDLPASSPMFNRCSTVRRSPVHRADTSDWDGRRMALSRRQLIHHGAAGAGLVVVGNLTSLFTQSATAAPLQQGQRAGSGATSIRRSWATGYGALAPDPAKLLDLPDGFTYTVISEAGSPLTGTDGTCAGRLRRHRALRGRRPALPGPQQRAGISRGGRTDRVPGGGGTRVHVRPGGDGRDDDDGARRRQQRRRRVRQPGRHARPTAPAASPRGARG